MLETKRLKLRQWRLDEVVSFTAVINYRSEAVMKRFGMKNSHENFEHPSIPMGHGLKEHLLYRLRREEWSSE